MSAESASHWLLVAPGSVPAALARLRDHGIDAEAEKYDLAEKAVITWLGPKNVDLDFLRPDILPPE